jgi:hypothetical protein
MNEKAIIDRITSLEGVDGVTASAATGAPEAAWGDTFFTYDPERRLDAAQQFPFATIVTKDYGDFDNASDLNRPGLFRLNVGVGSRTYESLFGPAGAAHLAGGGRDFSVADTLLPHPAYARQHWVCIVNPGDETFEREIWPLLLEAHETAAARYHRQRKTPLTREVQEA